jgi:hypothetical protein
MSLYTATDIHQIQFDGQLIKERSGPGCSKYWIKLSTGQLLIQWTASQWIKLVVQKQRQGLAKYPKDKILSSGQLP